MCGRTDEQCNEKRGAGALLVKSYNESHRPTSLAEETYVAGGEGVPRLVRHVKERARPKPLVSGLKRPLISGRLNPTSRIYSNRLERPAPGSPPLDACATLVGMRRIAWPLLSAVLLAAAPAAGQPAARPTPTVTLEQATRTLDAGRHRLAASQFRAARRAPSPDRPAPGSAWARATKRWRASRFRSCRRRPRIRRGRP